MALATFAKEADGGGWGDERGGRGGDKSAFKITKDETEMIEVAGMKALEEKEANASEFRQ